MTCTRCDGTGFLNVEGLPENMANQGPGGILEWIAKNPGTDVQVCDCCGDGHGWHGEPGQHYTGHDPSGKSGPYAYNGGLAECH